MTTLLTHNAVVSILMENFQKNLNNKRKLVTPSVIVVHRGQEVSFSYRHPRQSFQFLTWRKFLDSRLTGVACILTSTEY